MDFFDLQNVPRVRIKTTEEAHMPAIAAGADCLSCDLYGCRRGPVMGQIVANARLTVIGEAPDTDEVQSGVPFTGASGVELDQSLNVGGVARSDCSVTNVILCQPPEDFDDYLEKLTRAHKKAAEIAVALGQPPPHQKLSPVTACAARLTKDINTSAAKTVLAVGGKALRAMAQRYGVGYGTGVDSDQTITLATIKGQHGSPVTMPDGVILCSTLHPSFARWNNRQYTQVVRDNIARAARISVRGIDWKEPILETFIMWPTQEIAIRRVEEMCALFVAHKTSNTVKCDIETDSIMVKTARVRCIGFSMLSHIPSVISIPLLWMDGREYWGSLEFRLRAEAAIRSVLDECTLTFHNGIYDTGVLLERNLMSDAKKKWVDTILLHRNTDSNDLPHDLGFVVRQFTEAPLWKKDIDHKGGGGTTDAVYHKYNAKDVLGTDRIEAPLVDRVHAVGNLAQFKLDTALAPIARDMGRLGLFVDEVARGDLSLKFNIITKGLIERTRVLTDQPDFNPRAHGQVKDYLYNFMGYTPAMNTDGYEFEVGDDPASSVPALMKLLDMGVDANTEQLIDTLIEFSACDKLRGGYIDNLHVDYSYTRHMCRAAVPAVEMDGREILPARPDVSWMPVTWKIHVIPSGRWVCNPTIQNWPSRGWIVNGHPTNMRKMIVAPPGHVLVGADYEQIEARIFAVITNDAIDLRAFKNDDELHCLTAATIMAERESEILPMYAEFLRQHKHGTKDEKSLMKFTRTVAKRIRYLKAYGGGEDKLFAAMSSERDKATGKRVFKGLLPTRVAEWEERWNKRHPETAAYHRQIAQFVRQHGYVATAFGSYRKRHFVGGPNKKNAPPNHGVQGCLQGHVRVLTRSGMHPISEAPETGEAWTGTSWATYKRLSRGLCQLAKIELGGGETVDCDTRHQVLVEGPERYEFRHFKDLKIGDSVCTSIAAPIEFGTQTCSIETAYWLGYSTGNGSSNSQRNDVHITIGDRKQRHSIVPQAARWRKYIRSVGLSPQKTRQVDDKECVSIGATIRWLWEPLGYIWGATSHDKRVPSAIWTGSLAIRKAFLQGVLDADGSVGGSTDGATHAPNVHLGQRELLSELQILFRSVGVESKVYGPYKQKKPSGQPTQSWRLNITHSQLAAALAYGTSKTKRIRSTGQLAPAFAVKAFVRATTGKMCKPNTSEATLLHRLRHGGSTSVRQLIVLYTHFNLVAPELYTTRRISDIYALDDKQETFTLALSDPLHRFDAGGVIHKNSAGDMKNEAILKINEAIPFGCWSPYTGLCLDIHDYLAVCVPESRAEQAKMMIEKCMYAEMTCADGWKMPFPAKAEISRSLADQ